MMRHMQNPRYLLKQSSSSMGSSTEPDDWRYAESSILAENVLCVLWWIRWLETCRIVDSRRDSPDFLLCLLMTALTSDVTNLWFYQKQSSLSMGLKWIQRLDICRISDFSRDTLPFLRGSPVKRMTTHIYIYIYIQILLYNILGSQANQSDYWNMQTCWLQLEHS